MNSLDEEFTLDNDVINLRKQNTVDDASYFQMITPPHMISNEASTMHDQQEGSDTFTANQIGPWPSSS